MNLSIRSKLILIIGLTTAIALCIAFAIVVWNDVVGYRSQTAENTVLIAKVVGEYSVSDLIFADEEAAAETLVKLSGVPDIKFACLFDAQGNLFATFGSDDGRPVDMMSLESPVVFDDSYLEVVQPVIYHDELFGTLYLRSSTAGLNAKIFRRVLTLSLLLVGLVAVVLIAAYRLQRIISQPILDLAAATHEISETGNYSIRVTSRGHDEISILVNGFNEMLDQIQLRQLERDEAVHRTREKSHFLAAMSHELRTPLNSIIGFSEILLRRSDFSTDPKYKSFLENIQVSGQHLLGIINDILDISKVEAGKMELVCEPVALHSIIGGVSKIMRGASQKRQVEIRVDGTSNIPIIEADPVKLKQVFFNLISNAVKFSPEGSVVHVSAKMTEAASSILGEDSVEIAFIDHGIGIAEGDYERIFQPFKQADSGISRKFGGTGLGLSLVRSFVHKHGGRLLLESKLGEGSIFTVVLPLKIPESGVANHGGAEVEEEFPKTSQRIVVVEDDHNTLLKIKDNLVGAGFEVVAASTGEQAIDLIRKVMPVAIVLDIILPGIDGWAVLKEIKTNLSTAGIPVVICSELRNDDLAVALGADEYFIKPLGIEKLAMAVLRLIGQEEVESPRILIIDDDPVVHDQLEARFLPMGFRIDHANSGAEGLEMASTEPPGLVVLDLMMDGMNGFEVALRLRSQASTADVPIVVLTAADLTADDHQRLHCKVTALVRKGEDERRSLVTVVRRLLIRQQRRGVSADISETGLSTSVEKRINPARDV